MLAQHVTRTERGALLEEVIPLLRRLWSGEVVHHNGPRYQLRDTRLSPTPVQEPLEMWLGGQAPGALRRAGRLRDFVVPYQHALETEASKRNVRLSLQGLLSHVPRKHAEDIATLVDVERLVLQAFIGTASWDYCSLITVDEVIR